MLRVLFIYREVFSETVIILEDGIGAQSSNPGQSC